jgi:hypothetical protein
MEHYLEKDTNMKLITSIFERLFGLKINLCSSSEIFSFWEAKEEVEK